ncbi:MAG: PPOX class F420-dependent oxidoreductase [Anaerolineae bacterium]|nr:MAG: PPOX class F420-dependent oxidoreductase [Anaerolineae bacterium]
MNGIPTEYLDLFADEVRAFAFMATVMADGSPQVTPVWFNTEDETILINSAKGRTKDRNVEERPQVALAIMDPADPYRYIQIRGKVVEITTDGADAHINALSHKYRGKDYVIPAGQQRVTYKIRPESVSQ